MLEVLYHEVLYYDNCGAWPERTGRGLKQAFILPWKQYTMFTWVDLRSTMRIMLLWLPPQIIESRSFHCAQYSWDKRSENAKLRKQHLQHCFLSIQIITVSLLNFAVKSSNGHISLKNDAKEFKQRQFYARSSLSFFCKVFIIELWRHKVTW